MLLTACFLKATFVLLETLALGAEDACVAPRGVASSEEEHIEHHLSPAYASEERERASVPHLHS